MVPATHESAPPPLVVGVIVGPHGLRGAVKVRLHNEASTALRPGIRVMLRDLEDAKGHNTRARTITECQAVPHKRQVRLQLEGVDGRDAAEALRGVSVLVDRGDLPPLDSDEFYLADAVGLPVERALPSGELQNLGVIEAVMTGGPQDFFEVVWSSARGQRESWLLPVGPPYIVDIVTPTTATPGAGRVRVELPEGLLPETLGEPGEP